MQDNRFHAPELSQHLAVEGMNLSRVFTDLFSHDLIENVRFSGLAHDELQQKTGVATLFPTAPFSELFLFPLHLRDGSARLVQLSEPFSSSFVYLADSGLSISYHYLIIKSGSNNGAFKFSPKRFNSIKL